MFFFFILILSQCLSAARGFNVDSLKSNLINTSVYPFFLKGCSLWPVTASMPETPIRRHGLFNIFCHDLDSSVDVCMFSHYGPYDNEGIDEVKCSFFIFIKSLYFCILQPTICTASSDDNGLHTCHDDTRIYTEFYNHTCGIRVILSEPDDMGVWNIQMASISGDHVEVEVSVCRYRENSSAFSDIGIVTFRRRM